MRLKPLLSFTYDNGKTSMEMLAGEYETVQYKVRFDEQGDSVYSRANSNQGANSNSETMEVRSRQNKADSSIVPCLPETRPEIELTE